MFFNSYFDLVQANSTLIAFNILFFALLIVIFWSQKGFLTRIESKKNILYVVLLSLFCVFAFYDSDWFSYLTIYNDYVFTNEAFDFSFEHLVAKEANSHMESIYYLFFAFSNGSYLLFRVYIWGLAIVLAAITAKRLEVGKTAFYIVFATCFLLYYCYGRVPLAYSIAFLGYSFIVKPIPRKSFLSIALGLFIVFVSIFFHKTAVFIIPVFLLSLLPFNKKTFSLYITSALPLLLILSLVSDYIFRFDMEDNLTMVTLQGQLEKTEGISFSGSFIRNVISKYMVYLPFYLFFFGIAKRANNGRLQNLPRPIQKMAGVACWIIFMSTILLLANQYMMFYRFILYSLIPISITLAAIYIKEPQKDKLVNSILYCGLFFSSYKLAYVFYLSLVN